MIAGQGITLVRDGHYAVTIRAMPVALEGATVILGPVLSAVVLSHPAALVLDLLALGAGRPIPGLLAAEVST